MGNCTGSSRRERRDLDSTIVAPSPVVNERVGKPLLEDLDSATAAPSPAMNEREAKPLLEFISDAREILPKPAQMEEEDYFSPEEPHLNEEEGVVLDTKPAKGDEQKTENDAPNAAKTSREAFYAHLLASESDRLYNQLLNSKSEPVLPVEDVQGDCILGFNKRFTRRLVIGLKDRDDCKVISETKDWLKRFSSTGINDSVKITSLKDILEHRKIRNDMLSKGLSPGSYDEDKNVVFCNVSFSHQCLDLLLTGTLYAETMRAFNSRDPFVIGSKDRGTLLGDHKYQHCFEFGKDRNDDILINIASDSKKVIDDATEVLKNDFKNIFEVVNDTECDRGIKEKNAFYGHEHFGFQDGLSQPTVRGTYYNEKMEKKFIVRRTIDASDSDKRYLNYSRPGFRLCDIGHFILGQEYIRSVSDDIDPRMSNPNPDVYRQRRGAYPDWCTGGSFVVYRKIQQVSVYEVTIFSIMIVS